MSLTQWLFCLLSPSETLHSLSCRLVLYLSLGKERVTMFRRQTEIASDTYQLLDADPRQHRVFTPACKSLENPSASEDVDERSSAFQSGLNHQSTDQPPGWISKPRELRKSRKSHFFDLALEGIMVLIPLPFLVLAAAVASVHGKRVDQYKLDALNQSAKTARITLYTFASSILTISGINSIHACFRGNHRTRGKEIYYMETGKRQCIRPFGTSDAKQDAISDY